jgi:hypothetical protein
MFVYIIELIQPICLGLVLNIGSILSIIFHFIILFTYTLSDELLAFTIVLLFICAVNMIVNVCFLFFIHTGRKIILLKLIANLTTIVVNSISLFWLFYSVRKDILIMAYISNVSLFILEGRELIRRSKRKEHSLSRIIPIVTLHEQLNTDPEYVCPICLSEAKYCVNLKCNHAVCTECTKELLKVSNKCPCCREIIYTV